MSIAGRLTRWLPNFGDMLDGLADDGSYWWGAVVTAAIGLLFGTGSFVALLVMAMGFLVWGQIRG